MVVTRLQAIVRTVLTNSYNQVILTFTNNKECLPSIEIMRIQLQLVIKEGKIESIPSSKEIKSKIINQISYITYQLNTFACPSKSYLYPIRPNNVMQIEEEPYQLNNIRDNITNTLNNTTDNLDQFLSPFNLIVE